MFINSMCLSTWIKWADSPAGHFSYPYVLVSSNKRFVSFSAGGRCRTSWQQHPHRRHPGRCLRTETLSAAFTWPVPAVGVLYRLMYIDVLIEPNSPPPPFSNSRLHAAKRKPMKRWISGLWIDWNLLQTCATIESNCTGSLEQILQIVQLKLKSIKYTGSWLYFHPTLVFKSFC